MPSRPKPELPHLPELEDAYELVRELGRGGSAVVYLARERALARDVAIKLIRPGFGTDEEAVARLVREARTVGTMQHPNIVMLFGTRRLAGGGLALVLQYVPGETLKAHVERKGRLPVPEVQRILGDLARALAYAHRRRIVHRDVKPENVYLDEEAGLARLADFGIARPWDSDSGLTLPGSAIGTPAYMSPEQVEGGRLDGRSDLYSLGLVAWEMLTGRAPWAGESLYEIIYKQKHEELPALETLRPDLPDHLCLAVERALRKDPDDRWRSAEAFLEALAGAPRRPDVALPPVATPQSGTVRSDEPAPSRGAGSGVPVLFGLVLLGGVVAGALTGSFDDRIRSVLGQIVPAERERTTPEVRPPGPVFPDGAPGAGIPERPAVTPEPQSDDQVTLRREADPDDAPAAPPEPRTAEDPLPESTDADPPEPANPTPAPEAAPTPRLTVRTEIAPGGTHTCHLDAEGELGCWGGNRWGQLGAGGRERRLEPGPRVPGGPFARIASGLDHACALDTQGVAHCWGSNDRGQLGDGTTLSRSEPVLVADLLPLIRIAAGAFHTCGETGAGEVFCWGANDEGQLGDGTTGARFLPVQVEAAAPLRGVSAGWAHSCALDDRGRAYCWGSNHSGELGRSTQDRLTASTPISGTAVFTELSAGSAHTCGLAADGTVHCWGSNASGQLGDGSIQSRRVPTPVASDRVFVSIAAGAVHTCGLDSTGAARCWGRNLFGQLGDGTTTDRTRPVEVAAPTALRELRAFGSHTCARTVEDEILCWGYNGEGQLGDGTRTDRRLPTRIGATAGS